MLFGREDLPRESSYTFGLHILMCFVPSALQVVFSTTLQRQRTNREAGVRERFCSFDFAAQILFLCLLHCSCGICGKVGEPIAFANERLILEMYSKLLNICPFMYTSLPYTHTHTKSLELKIKVKHIEIKTPSIQGLYK